MDIVVIEKDIIMLAQKIYNDLIAAMKGKNILRTSVLRMLKAAMGNKAIELNVSGLEDNDVISLIRKDVKRHQDSIEQFKKGGRIDLASKEEDELKILKSYLPKEASVNEIKSITLKVIEEINASGKKEFGKIIKGVMEKLKGSADGKLISSIVNELLENKEKTKKP